MYVYQRTEQGLYTVGFFTPKGEWVPESDYQSCTGAAERVNYLNGGGLPPQEQWTPEEIITREG